MAGNKSPKVVDPASCGAGDVPVGVQTSLYNLFSPNPSQSLCQPWDAVSPFSSNSSSTSWGASGADGLAVVSSLSFEAAPGAPATAGASMWSSPPPASTIPLFALAPVAKQHTGAAVAAAPSSFFGTYIGALCNESVTFVPISSDAVAASASHFSFAAAPLPTANGDAVDIFLGQLSHKVSREQVRHLVNSVCNASAVMRIKEGPNNNCYFVTVLREFEGALLRLNKTALCDLDRVWIATNAAGVEALDAAVKSSVGSRSKGVGVPKSLLVVERSKAPTHHTNFTATPPAYQQQPNHHHHNIQHQHAQQVLLHQRRPTPPPQVATASNGVPTNKSCGRCVVPLVRMFIKASAARCIVCEEPIVENSVGLVCSGGCGDHVCRRCMASGDV